MIDYKYLFLSMSFFIGLKYFTSEKPKFIIEFKREIK